nr:hypothetical protein HmN_000475200 [Hymenolepis microstoma]
MNLDAPCSEEEQAILQDPTVDISSTPIPAFRSAFRHPLCLVHYVELHNALPMTHPSLRIVPLNHTQLTGFEALSTPYRRR